MKTWVRGVTSTLFKPMWFRLLEYSFHALVAYRIVVQLRHVLRRQICTSPSTHLQRASWRQLSWQIVALSQYFHLCVSSSPWDWRRRCRYVESISIHLSSFSYLPLIAALMFGDRIAASLRTQSLPLSIWAVGYHANGAADLLSLVIITMLATRDIQIGSRKDT